MRTKDSLYDDKIVIKPWGYEYVVYREKNDLSVTLLNINYKEKTSLHCHPKKKSGFIVLQGKALFQLGLWKKRREIKTSCSKRMIARGLFHQITSLSKKGLMALEFETPVNKKDLVRFKDSYGRQRKTYEGKEFTKNIKPEQIKFKKPTISNKRKYFIGDCILTLEVHKDFKNLTKNTKDTLFAILKGAVTDNKGNNVLEYGDIVKTIDFKVFSKVFKIKNRLTVLKVNKI